MRTTLPWMLIVLSGLLILTTGDLLAGEFRNVGQSGANFLQIPVDAEGAALANSNVAMAVGAEGLYWNPAAISLGDGTEIILSTVDWFLDARIAHAGITHNFGHEIGAMGMSVTALTMGEMEITTEYEPDGTGQYFDAGDLALGLTYARAFTDRFNFGASVKWVYEYIWEASTSQFAFDFGSLYRTDFYNMRLGMSISNFGGILEMSGDPIDDKLAQEAALGEENNPREERLAEEYSLPQYFNFGLAIDPYENEDHRITAAAAVNDPNDNQTRISFGTEYAFQETFMFRLGYKLFYDEQRFSLGAGFKFKVSGNEAAVDYAFSEFGILEDIHFLTFRVGL